MHPAPHTPPPTGREMLWELVELAGGFAVMFLPLLVLAVPGIALVVAPVAVLLLIAAIPVTVVAALIGLPYLLVRAVRRQRSGGGRGPATRRRAGAAEAWAAGHRLP